MSSFRLRSGQALGSISLTTDEGGNVVSNVRYDFFGSVRCQSQLVIEKDFVIEIGEIA